MPTLLGLLMARPEADLPALAAAWGVPLSGRGRRADSLALYRAMTDRWTLRDVLETLSPIAARRLWRLMHGRAAASDTPAAALTELVAKGLLHVPAGGDLAGAALADETAAQLRRLADERRRGDLPTWSLPDLIATLGSADIAAALDHWTGATGALARSESEAALLAALTAPLARDDMIAQLERDERLLFGLVDGAARPIRLSEVRRRARLSPGAVRDALRGLHARALVWETWAERRRWLFVPRELRQPARHQLTPVAAEAGDWRHPYSLAWDVLAGLRQEAARSAGQATDAGPWPVDYPLWGLVGAATSADYRRFATLAVGVVSQRPDHVAWAARSLADQQRVLVDLWRETGLAATTVAVGDGRSAMLDALTLLEVGQWYPLDAVAQAVGQSGGSRRTETRAARSVIQALRTTLTWLGLVELGRAVDGPVHTARLTPFGAWCLAGAERPPDDVPAVVVEPSYRVLVYAVDAPLLWELLAFAAPEYLDRVSIFRLTRTDALRGLRHGLAADAMVAALTRASRHELPQGVIYALRDWVRPAVPARVERVLLLTFDDARARDAALAQPRLRGLHATPIGAQQVAVPIPDAATEAAARSTLRALGLTT